MRGRKPKPVQRGHVEGDTRHVGVHKLDAAIAALPKAQRGLPDPPPHVTGLAREQWFVWKRDLELMQLDYAADAAMLEGACVNYARAIEQDEILKDGCQVEEPVFDRLTGAKVGARIKNHPATVVSNNCWRNVQMFCSNLGLSIVARQRLSVEVGETGVSNKLYDLLTGPRAVRPTQDEESKPN